MARLAILAMFLSAQAEQLLPIFLMHGINTDHKDLNEMEGWIREIDPNVFLYSFPICDDSASFTNLWDQVQEIMDSMREHIEASPDAFKDGCTLIAHSQGALIARTVIERMDDHNIHTFIGLAGPQAGEYGVPENLDNKWVKELSSVGKELVFTLTFQGLKGEEFQKWLSVANYWNDPRTKAGLFHPHNSYLNGNTFLPVLNNDPQRGTQGPGKEKDNSEAARYKANLMRLQKAVFTAGTADKMIIPYQSGVWGFYDESGDKVVDIKDTPMWSEDWLGLRALQEAGNLTLDVVDGVCHTCWTHQKSIFTAHIKPHLPYRHVQQGSTHQSWV